MTALLDYYNSNIKVRIESMNYNATKPPSQVDYMPCTRCYDILIPIYNAYEFTFQCIEHVIKHTDHRHPLYLLDDASTDPRMKPMLKGFADRFGHVSFLESSKNLGFVQNMNRGFTLSRNDVVILNSDTQVTKGWLERMDRCLAEHPNTAVISPLSNNATFLSVPLMNTKNELTCGHTPDSVAELVALHSSRIYPVLPVAVGFCMLMTRASLNRLGGFDTAFGKGYGEECDYCMRVWAAGMEVRCCDDAYVYHFGEASFIGIDEISSERIKNRELINSRWPDYLSKIHSYCLINPLLKLQEKIFHLLNTDLTEKRPHILHVIDSISDKASHELHTLRLVSLLFKHSRSTIFLPHEVENSLDVEAESVNESVRIALFNQKTIKTDDLFCGYPNGLSNDLVERKFEQFVAGGDYSVIHFQHLIKWDSLLLPFIAKALGKKVVISLHDYFLLCPEYNLILPSLTKCDKAYALEDDESCFACLGAKRSVTDLSKAAQLHEYLAERHAIVGLMLEEADAIVAPSDFVKKQFVRAFGDSLKGKIRVIPHGVSVSAQISRPERSKDLRVAFVGNFTYQKGAKCFLDAAEELEDKNISFHVFGGIADKTLAEKARRSNITLHGSYQVEDLPKLLEQIDIVLIPSVWHETFCLTLSEAQALGVPVIAADVGALSERIIDGKTGYLFRTSDSSHLSEIVFKISQNTDSLNPVINALSKQRIKTIRENAEDYAQLYSELMQDVNSVSILLNSKEIKVDNGIPAVTDNDEFIDEGVLKNRLIDEACSRARIQSLNDDIDGAVRTLLNQGIKADPAYLLPYITLSEILITAGRFEDALGVLPEMPSAVEPAIKHELAAICHCGLGDDAAALQAAQLADGRPRALVVLGTLAARQGDPAEAERLFRQAIQTDPSCGSGWLSLGMLLWGQGRHDEAFEAVKQAVTADPLNREAVQILRDMAERLG